jgi:HEAT repeat protein
MSPPRLLLPVVLLVLALTGGGCASAEKDLRATGASKAEDRVLAASSIAAHVEAGDAGYTARKAELSKALRDMLDDRSALVRQAAIDALATVEGPEATAVLVDRLRDRDAWVRYAAAKALGRVGSPAAVEPLGAVLRQDESPDVRRAAARALEERKGEAAIYDLYLALSDPSPAVRFHAYLALRAITGKDYGLDARAWREVVPQSQR